MHVRAAIRNGLTPEEIREVLLHTAVYAGVPAANSAFAIAQEVLDESVTERRRALRPVARTRTAVIRAFGARDPELTLSDVARRPGSPAPPRADSSSRSRPRLRPQDGKQFALTPRVLELGYAYLSSLTLPEMAEPHLERLAAEVQESSSVSVLDGDDIVYVARVPTRRIMRVTINVGTRFPAYATSMGRVLLAGLPDESSTRTSSGADRAAHRPRVSDPDALRAELDKVREQGWALVDQELEEGLRRSRRPCATAPAAWSPP